MTARDRTVLMVVGLIAVVAAFWFLLLAPKSDDVKSLKDQITVAQTRLQTAQTSLAGAQAAKANYRKDVATVARLGKAVPADDDIPSLVYQLQRASVLSNVAWGSIQLTGTGAATTAPPAASTATGQVAGLAQEQKGANGTTSTASTATTPTTPANTAATPATTAANAAAIAASQAAFAGLPPGAVVGPSGFPTIPFKFTFGTTYSNFERLLRKLGRFTKVDANSVKVAGRLLTIDGFSIENFPYMKASVTATAFMQTQDQAAATPAATATPSTQAPSSGSGTPAPAVATAAPVAGVTP